MSSALGHFVIKVTYGEKILAEMGDNLTRWNVELNELAAKGFLGFWLVDYLHFREFFFGCDPFESDNQMTNLPRE